MIRPEDDWPSEQMLPVLLETICYPEELSTSDTVVSLRRCKDAARIADDMQFSTLFLLKNSTKSGVGCVCVKHILSLVTWCDKNRCCQESILQVKKCNLTVRGPVANGTLLSKVMQWSRLSCKVLDKCVMIASKTTEGLHL